MELIYTFMLMDHAVACSMCTNSWDRRSGFGVDKVLVDRLEVEVGRHDVIDGAAANGRAAVEVVHRRRGGPVRSRR